MRTTLTLDPDIAAALQERARRTGTTWKEVVNEALRQGLFAEAPPQSSYATPVHEAGPARLVGVHGVHDLLAFAEGDDYR